MRFLTAALLLSAAIASAQTDPTRVRIINPTVAAQPVRAMRAVVQAASDALPPYVITSVAYNASPCTPVEAVTGAGVPCWLVVPLRTRCVVAVGRSGTVAGVAFSSTVDGVGGCTWALTDADRKAVVEALGGIMPDDCAGPVPPSPTPAPAPVPQPSGPAYGVWSSDVPMSNAALRALGFKSGDMWWVAQKTTAATSPYWWTIEPQGVTPPPPPDGALPVNAGAIP